MILDTPNIVRADGFSCGVTSLEVVYRYHGVPWPRAFSALSNPARGMSPETAEAAIRAGFGGVAWGQGWTVADLAHHLRHGRPVMCLVSGDEAADHWVVARGVSRGRVYYHCPGDGRGSKSAEAWAAWWTGPPGNAYSRFGLVGWL